MKTIIRFSLLVFIGTLSLTSCDKSNTAPNAIVGENFTGMYPDAKQVEWEMERGFYVAEFRENGYEKEAWFNKDYAWVLTKTEYERRTPDIVRQAVNNTDYRDWRIDDIDYIEMAGKEPFYIVEVEKNETETDLYISHTGELIREISEEGDYHREIFD